MIHPANSTTVIIIIFLLLLPFLTSCKDHSWAEQTLSEMTLDQKVGQMFVAPAKGNFLTPAVGGIPRRDLPFEKIERLITEYHVGGFRIYGGEVVQTAALVNKMNSISEIPLFFASDIEAGLGSEFLGGTRFPALMGIGASGSADLAYNMGKATAIEARAIGLNMVQSPVLDINNNPQNPIINYRAFSEDPEVVTKLGVAFIRGLQDHGVISTVKHFPGHGDTDIDSHIELPVVLHDRVRLDSVELVPFRAAIQEKAGAIMVAHMGMPQITPEVHEPSGMPMPSTLSPLILEDLLRGEPGYNGLLITDAMRMGGITKHFSSGEAAIMAIMAGNDLLLSFEDMIEAITAVRDAVRSGKLPEERIDQSVYRILSAKEQLGLHQQEPRDINALFETLGQPDILEDAMEAAIRSVVLLRDDELLVPLGAYEGKKLLNLVLSDQELSEESIENLTSKMDEQGLRQQTIVLHNQSDMREFQHALLSAENNDLIICHTFFRIRAYQGHVELEPPVATFLEDLQNREVATIIISYGNPYLIARMPGMGTYFAVFGDAPVLQQAIGRIMLGKAPAMGQMPVSLPGYFERGDGILRKTAFGNSRRDL